MAEETDGNIYQAIGELKGLLQGIRTDLSGVGAATERLENRVGALERHWDESAKGRVLTTEGPMAIRWNTMANTLDTLVKEQSERQQFTRWFAGLVLPLIGAIGNLAWSVYNFFHGRH